MDAEMTVLNSRLAVTIPGAVQNAARTALGKVSVAE
jgi:hypothetical protein